MNAFCKRFQKVCFWCAEAGGEQYCIAAPTPKGKKGADYDKLYFRVSELKRCPEEKNESR